MRKRIKQKKFSRKIGPRKALLTSVARSLIDKEKITTTESKAKEAARLVERMITKAKKGTLTSRRVIAASFGEKVGAKLMNEIAEQYKDRSGGYTRVTKKGPRKSDGAKMAIVELVK